jgi:predicted signal transduction protein with EAL and GGDEF domain
MGCNQYQGYYFARPGPASDISELIRRQIEAPRNVPSIAGVPGGS